MEELDVAEGEGRRVRGGVGVLTRSEEVKECDNNHISYRLKEMGVRWKVLCNLAQSLDDSDGDWLDTLGRRVLLLPSLQHSCDAEINCLGSIQPWIVFPHGEERLGNAP